MKIKHLFHIKSPREKVFREIAEVEGLRQWWTSDTRGETRLGGVVEFYFGGHLGCAMKVKALVENKEVLWECTAGHPDWIGTEVRFSLDENEGKTRVRFEHAGWKEDGDHYAICTFSWARYMESLRQLCQTGKGEGFGNPGYRT